jgi:hypothetical protein
MFGSRGEQERIGDVQEVGEDAWCSEKTLSKLRKRSGGERREGSEEGQRWRRIFNIEPKHCSLSQSAAEARKLAER